MEKINPKVSTWIHSRFPKKGEELKIINLYTVMKQCEQIPQNANKGESGSIFPYLSEEANPNYIEFDGVVFVDIDNCQNISDEIFESFDKICEALPNLLALNFSYSRNLHCYFYDKEIKDNPSIYGEKALLYLCAFAAAVKKITNIDLRNFEGALDTHSKSPNQRLFLNHSEFKWNIYCTEATIRREDVKRLKSEYFALYKISENKRTIVETKSIKGEGKISIDQNYNLLGYGTGYEARTLIASAVYHHFECDIEKSREYLSNTFENANEINIQMTSMVNNDRIAYKYRKDVEEFIFGFSVGKEIILQPNQWLSDVVDIDKLDGKYYYLQSNTGSGKTEFVKGIIKRKDDKIIYIQMTKALRDGKKQTIEDYTYENWDFDIKDENKIHMSLDGAVRHLKKIRKSLNKYIIVLDESHLLEDYIEIREFVINELLTLLAEAGKVIFMSATPKSDIKMFPFEKICYTRKQEQDIIIHRHPLSVSGKGSKVATVYEEMVKWIKAQKNKVIVFSNKKQELWKTYGLDCEGVTYFNSNHINDDAVQAVLQRNVLVYNITLSTLYMGCGVEVKHEKEVDIVFHLNEGFDTSSIIQSIGRPRSGDGGVEKVNIHFFYTEDCKFKGYYTTEDLQNITNAFDNLTITDEAGIRLNIVAAQMIGIRDSGFDEWKAKEKIKVLKLSYFIGNNTYLSPYSLDVLKGLPYRKVEIINHPTISLDKTGKKSRIRTEERLIAYLCSLRMDDLANIVSEDGYDALLNRGDIPYEDKVNARDTISNAMYIARHGIKLKEALLFFGTLKKAVRYIRALENYVAITKGEEVAKEFAGGEETYRKLLLDIEEAKLIFTDDYVNRVKDGTNVPAVINNDDLDIFDFESNICWYKEQLEKLEQSYNEQKIFRGNTFKECVKGNLRKQHGGILGSNEGKRKGGQKGGLKKYSIKIQKVESGEVFEFDSKTECMKFLGWSSKKFSDFVKNKRDKKNIYIVL